jgi:antitoxin component of MazEF toxin-antitoxin module
MFKLRVFVAGLFLFAAAVAFAGDDGGKHNVVIVGENGEKATLTLDGSRLTVTAEEGDDISVKEVDLAEIATMVDDALAGAMVGVQAAFDALAEQDIQVRVDSEHQIVVEADGETTKIDLDEVLDEVAAAMDQAAREFDEDSADEAELQQEIDALRAEIDKLRSELKRQ